MKFSKKITRNIKTKIAKKKFNYWISIINYQINVYVNGILIIKSNTVGAPSTNTYSQWYAKRDRFDINDYDFSINTYWLGCYASFHTQHYNRTHVFWKSFWAIDTFSYFEIACYPLSGNEPKGIKKNPYIVIYWMKYFSGIFKIFPVQIMETLNIPIHKKDSSTSTF